MKRNPSPSEATAALLGPAVFAVALLAGLTSPCFTAAADQSYLSILEGVHQIAAPGVPGQLAVFGEQAKILVVGASGNFQVPVVAAARWERGKIVAFAHDGYFRKEALETDDTGQLILNAIRWCGGSPVAVLAAHRDLYSFLASRGVSATLVESHQVLSALRRHRVFCAQISRLEPAVLPDLADFICRGGGLLAAETGWGWLQLNPGKTLLDNLANRLLHRAGLVWTDGTTRPTSSGGFDVRGEVPAVCHVHAARQILGIKAGEPLAGLAPRKPEDSRKSKDGNSDGQLRSQALFTLQQAMPAVPLENAEFWKPLRQYADPRTQPLPSPSRPVTEEMAADRLRISIFTEIARRCPADEVLSHPAVAEFPGLVPKSARRVERIVRLDPGQAGWQSTGCYAPPGEAIVVELPSELPSGQLVIQIGCHTDHLWHRPQWHRLPEVITRREISAGRTVVASPFGGLVFFEFLHPKAHQPLQVRLQGVVEAPFFVAGQTSAAAWQEMLKQSAAPWAELASRKIVLTVPTSAARKVTQPEAVLAFWDRVLDACAELAALPKDRTFPERIVTDVQISAGYMHAGYPIMTHLDVAELLVNPAGPHTDPRWGLFHELGHNHQESAWTFPEVSEVTCNLFTVYVLETVCDMTDRQQMHPGLRDRQRRIRDYFRESPSLERLGKDPFLGLIPYLQLQEAFGWDAFKQVFAQYRGLRAEERPRTTSQKVDLWVITFSKTVGRNLAQFHRAWGFPVSREAESQIADLPSWMPNELPPR